MLGRMARLQVVFRGQKIVFNLASGANEFISNASL
jgi:hypothetical protein